MSRRVRFDEIPPQGLRLELEIAERQLGLDQRQLAPLVARLVLTRQGAARVLMQGHLSASVELTCDRCLAEYAQPVEEELLLLLEWQGNGSGGEAEWDRAAPEEAPETIQLDAPAVDVDEVLRQQVCLSLPLKHLCREDCPGLCPGCGALRGSSECRCAEQRGASPFAQLDRRKRR